MMLVQKSEDVCSHSVSQDVFLLDELCGTTQSNIDKVLFKDIAHNAHLVRENF